MQLPFAVPQCSSKWVQTNPLIDTLDGWGGPYLELDDQNSQWTEVQDHDATDLDRLACRNTGGTNRLGKQPISR